MLTIKKIIDEADVRVPNVFDSSQKVDWLNQINTQFFDVVKIPMVHSFVSPKGVKEFTLPNHIRSKNIDKVTIGTMIYESMQYENVQPGRSFWDFNDATYKLTLSDGPIETDKGIVRHSMIATTTFVSNVLTAVPDAPDEYHWIYILGLCEKIAKAQEDISKANNYANEFMAQLSIAQQNFKGR